MGVKVCSFLPGATDMIQQLGLDEWMRGFTFECPSDRPKVVRSHLEGNHHSSDEIDRDPDLFTGRAHP
jgi:iron complex transport system substrate-binding protein